MPTYAYRCASCAHEFEQFQRMSDAPLTECPECGSAVRRVIFPVGVVFKGSGWYINDSRKKPETEGATKSDEKEAKKSSGTKDDAKPTDGAKKQDATTKTAAD